MANRIFVTCYMGSENSSEETRSRAKNLAQDVGSYHMGRSFLLYNNVEESQQLHSEQWWSKTRKISRTIVCST